MCVRSGRSYLLNKITGEVAPAHCKAYFCPDCGPIKKFKLTKALKQYLDTWKLVRFWTFTLKRPDDLSVKKHLQILREAWRRFITYMRRLKTIHASARKFLFIKVAEEHAKGQYHYHVFISEYLPYSIVQRVWENICKDLTNSTEHSGQVWVKAMYNTKQVANYITKYVTKMTLKLAKQLRRYSKSNGIVLFVKREKVQGWYYIWCKMHENNPSEHYEVDLPPLLVINQHNFTGIPPDALENLDNELKTWTLTDTSMNAIDDYKTKMYNPLTDPSEEPQNQVNINNFLNERL